MTKQNKGSKSKYKIINYFIFFCYIIILMNILFFSDYYGRTTIKDEYTYNLYPFKEIKRFIQYRDYLTLEEWTTNLFGNVLAFIPLGFFLPLITRHYRKFFKVFFSSIFISLSVEILQLIYRVGIFDVDDIILNTFGGVLGYILYKILIYLNKKKNKGKKG
ncbi:MAG: VanZ family protein [bacterium]